MAKKYIIVQTHTNKRRISIKIAEHLIADRLASCVNIYTSASSIYRYNNRIVRENEYLIHSKTTSDKFRAIEKLIGELHNYETPEIIALEIFEGNKKYLEWIYNEIN